MPENEAPKYLIRSMTTYARFVTKLTADMEDQLDLKPEEPLPENYMVDLNEKLQSAKEQHPQIEAAYLNQATTIAKEKEAVKNEKIYMDGDKEFAMQVLQQKSSFNLSTQIVCSITLSVCQVSCQF